MGRSLYELGDGEINYRLVVVLSLLYLGKVHVTVGDCFSIMIPQIWLFSITYISVFIKNSL